MIQTLPFLNNPKDLHLSYKTDLDFWHGFGRKNLRLITEKIWYHESPLKVKYNYYLLTIDIITTD